MGWGAGGAGSAGAVAAAVLRAREGEAFLRCGILAHGVARSWCAGCGKDDVVAFSCKGRGFCPSCGARRMADTARWLLDRVMPDEAPVRQWTGAQGSRRARGLSCGADPGEAPGSCGARNRAIGSRSRRWLRSGQPEPQLEVPIRLG
ncbi:MAG: transposase zinc-binding domain-containing protein [Planctomycetes bacterium]|nr:transposase zinc-binding domain-containing protein [Planctomycetota bacterium]